MCRAVLCVIVAIFASILPLRAQTADAGGWPNGSVELNGGWRVQAGDDPAYAQTGYDDSGWQRSDLPASLVGSSPVVWYRLREGATGRPAALLVAPRTVGCTVYVNAVKLADCNQLFGVNRAAQRGIFIHLPGNVTSSPFLLAIRLDQPIKTRSGGLGIGRGDVLLGSPAALEDHRTAVDAIRFYRLLPQALLCLIELLGGTVLLLVFAQDRERREYLWFAAFLWLDGAASLNSVFSRVYPLPWGGWHAWPSFFGLIARYAPLISFLAAFTRVRVGRALRVYQWILLLTPELLAMPFLFASSEALFQSSGLFLALQLPFVIGSLIFLAWQWHRGNREAALLLPPFVLANGIEIAGLTIPSLPRIYVGHFSFEYDDLSMFFFLVSILPLMLLRHQRMGREHARATAELEAAREIQQQLVPADLPAVSGYTLEAVYLPAQEVGGDFYQVIAQADGATLIVVGDVSGKGLKAAMTGTLAIGALRTLAAENLGPAALLTRLNRQIVQAQNGGFVTCLCARIYATDCITFTNAGHLSPYRNGSEVLLENGLPLGLTTDAEYAETTLQLEPGSQVTFLTDGVLEATDASGELFGFDRMAAISHQSADRIAQSARQFGQEDDITVLTIRRAEFAEAAHA